MPPKLIQHLYRHLCAALLLLPAFLFAGLETKDYDIPEGEARSTLRKFAAQSNEQVMYTSDAIADVRTKAVKGSFSVAEGLERMLTGTDLVIVRDEKSGAVRIVREEKANAKNAERAASRNDRPQKDEVADKKVELPVVEVMGSKLLNMDVKRSIDDPQPYTIFTRETIKRSGAVNVQDFLRQNLTQATITNPATINGNSSIDLRGLGVKRTLLLVDGKRIPRSTTTTDSAAGQANINGIPLSAIERIDVLPATASAIYGGDALGGVINVILRRDYVGFEVKATYDNTFDTDAANKRLEFSGGFTLEKGRTNVLFSASFGDTNILTRGDRRSYYLEYEARLLALEPTFYAPPVAAPLGATANIRSTAGGNLQLKPQYGGASLNSLITSLPIGYAGVASDSGAALVANAGTYNLGIFPTSQGVARQIGSPNAASIQGGHNEAGTLTIRRTFSSQVEAYLETTATNSVTVSPGSRVPASFTLAPTIATNPFNQTIQITVPNGGGEFLASSRFAERRVAGGLIVQLRREWMANLDYTWNQNKLVIPGTPAFSGDGTSAVTSGAVDVLRDPALFPVNLRGYYLLPQTNDPFPTAQDIASLRFSGPVLTLPGGRPTLTTLLERREDVRGESEQSSSSGTFLYPEKSQEVWSGYVEAQVPLVSSAMNWALVHELQLQLSVRHDDYTTKGSTDSVNASNPLVRRENQVNSTDGLVALRWKLSPDLAVRASYGTGFLPPNIQQVVPIAAPTAFTITDPIRGNSQYALAPGQRLTQGNPNLTPEESTSFSSGLIFTPRFLPGFRLSVDYVNIELTDAISTIPGGAINSEALVPERVQRGPKLPSDPAGWAGPIIFLDETLANISIQKVESYDVQASYEWDSASFGRFEVAVAGTWQPHRITQTLAGQPLIENMGYDDNIKFKGNARLRWDRGQWTLGWNAYNQSRHFVHSPPALQTAASIATAIRRQGDSAFVDGTLYHDVFGSYRFRASESRNWTRLLADTELQAGIRNVFNRPPRYLRGFPDFSFGDSRLSSYYVSLTKSF